MARDDREPTAGAAPGDPQGPAPHEPAPSSDDPARSGAPGDRREERPLATGRLDVPAGLPFEGNAHILVLAASSARRDATVALLQRDGDAGWEVDAAGRRDATRMKLALETFAVVVLHADHADLAPDAVIRVIEATRRWPSPAVIVHLDAVERGDAATPACDDGANPGVFRVLRPDASDAQFVEAVRDGIRRDAVRTPPRFETEPRPPVPPPSG